MWNVPKVLAKLKLRQILRQMFRGNCNVSRPDRALQNAEPRFDGVHVASVARIFLLSVINGAVRVTFLIKPAISAPLVSVNSRAFRNVGFDLTLERFAARVGDDLGNHFAVAVLHRKDNGFTARAATALSRPLAANIS